MTMGRSLFNAGLRRAIGSLMGAMLAAAAAGQGASAAEGDDLRDFRIGMTVNDLPGEGYGGFACGSDGGEAGTPLGGWSDFRTCEPEASGLHEVRFEYTTPATEFAKVNDKWEGTRVFGHPSVVSLLFDDAGMVRGIRIMTDPASRPYMRKKAFLLGKRAKFHFSPATWSCETLEASEDRRPVGGVYFNEVCENRYDDRLIRLETQLFRTSEQGPSDFVNRTQIEILDPQES